MTSTSRHPFCRILRKQFYLNTDAALFSLYWRSQAHSILINRPPTLTAFNLAISSFEKLDDGIKRKLLSSFYKIA